MARVDEVADGIYRISTLETQTEFQFNQFLIEDERPALIHTRMFSMYEDVRKAVVEVLDPARLAYVVCPHFEADECRGMGRSVAEAPEAVLESRSKTRKQRRKPRQSGTKSRRNRGPPRSSETTFRPKKDFLTRSLAVGC